MQRSTDQPRSGSDPCILIVDDHPLVCSYLSQMIDDAGMEVCGSTGSADDALALFRQHRPDLVIVDISLETSNGLSLIKRLRREKDDVRVLVLSSHDAMFYARRSREAGAQGYLNKQVDPATILDTLRLLLDGGEYWPEGGTGLKLGEALPVSSLTNRELEVFELIGSGLGTSEIAARLCLSVKTIETHREKIKKKLALPSGNALVREAIQWVTEQG